jgi:DNA-binding PucR family transcriptional regulator
VAAGRPRLALRRGPGATTGCRAQRRADDERPAAGLADPDLRQAFASSVLGDLLRYDEGHSGELLPTLEHFLDCGGSWLRTAERLHVHVNTLRYRIRRIEELTGRSVADTATRVDLQLALTSRAQAASP